MPICGSSPPVSLHNLRMPPMTGKSALQEALRAPLAAAEWRPRAAGWWTKEAAEDWTYVVAVGAATEGLPAGHANATLYVGVRWAPIETHVAKVCGVRD